MPKAKDIYEGSDGELTRRYYAALEQRGPIGHVALNLFRAQKCSARAKVYRGGVRGQGSFKRLAYDRKAFSLSNLCKVLQQHSSDLNISFGWKKEDQGDAFANWILYVDLPNGQVSFHSTARLTGPDYPGDWDRQHLSRHRILAFCDAVHECTVTNLSQPSECPVPSPNATIESHAVFREQWRLF